MIELISCIIKKDKTWSNWIEVLYQIGSLVLYTSFYRSCEGSIVISSFISTLFGVEIYIKYYSYLYYLPFSIVSLIYVMDYYYKDDNRPFSSLIRTNLRHLKLIFKLISIYEYSKITLFKTNNGIYVIVPFRGLPTIGRGSIVNINQLYRIPGLEKYYSRIPRKTSLVLNTKNAYFNYILYTCKLFSVILTYDSSTLTFTIYMASAREIYIGRYVTWLVLSFKSTALIQFISMVIFSIPFIMTGVVLLEEIRNSINLKQREYKSKIKELNLRLK